VCVIESDTSSKRLAAQGARMTGLAVDTRTLASGEVFLAYPGARRDGRDFIPNALRSGASAVLWERKGFEWDSTWKIPNLGVDDLRGLSGLLAHEVYGRPSEKLWTMGVTGPTARPRALTGSRRRAAPAARAPR